MGGDFSRFQKVINAIRGVDLNIYDFLPLEEGGLVLEDTNRFCRYLRHADGTLMDILHLQNNSDRESAGELAVWQMGDRFFSDFTVRKEFLKFSNTRELNPRGILTSPPKGNIGQSLILFGRFYYDEVVDSFLGPREEDAFKIACDLYGDRGRVERMTYTRGRFLGGDIFQFLSPFPEGDHLIIWDNRNQEVEQLEGEGEWYFRLLWLLGSYHSLREANSQMQNEENQEYAKGLIEAFWNGMLEDLGKLNQIAKSKDNLAFLNQFYENAKEIVGNHDLIAE